MKGERQQQQQSQREQQQRQQQHLQQQEQQRQQFNDIDSNCNIRSNNDPISRRQRRP